MITASIVLCWYVVAYIGVREIQADGGFIIDPPPPGVDAFVMWVASPLPPVCLDAALCFLARVFWFVGRCLDPVARWMFPQ